MSKQRVKVGHKLCYLRRGQGHFASGKGVYDIEKQLRKKDRHSTRKRKLKRITLSQLRRKRLRASERRRRKDQDSRSRLRKYKIKKKKPTKTTKTPANSLVSTPPVVEDTGGQPKLIALYLPQFHRIQENDLWWGEGFTEWTNTRKAEALFPEHYQPREPEGDNYYDLNNPEVKKWQVELARSHGIHGFCYYHYWFKGKLLLEKPLQEILQKEKPDFPFCLSWANEPWTRRWDGAEHEVLMPQEYGDESDWKEHFEYLLKAFKDRRYIRVDNKPLFAIYRPASIDNCEAMLSYWQQLAKENGLDGIYFVETMNGFEHRNIEGFQASFQFEPLYTTAHDIPDNDTLTTPVLTNDNSHSLHLIDYDVVWEQILKREIPVSDKRTFLGAFLDWDNSPRKGKNSTIFKGATPKKFETYLQRQIAKAKSIGSEFIFINAWNEWAEGTFLEPDKKFGHQYLEAVKGAMGIIDVQPESNSTDLPTKDSKKNRKHKRKHRHKRRRTKNR